MLIELPNGDWISPKTVAGVRVMVHDKFGPRVVIDTHQHCGHHIVEFNDADAARAWAAEFARKYARPEPEDAV